MRRLAIGALTMLLLVGCGDGSPHVSVERQGFSVRAPEGLGIAALVRVSGERTVERIPIEVRLFAGDREVLSERSTLPFCPPATDCWFAESYTSPDARDADRIVVEAGAGVATDARRRVVELRDGPAPDDGLVAFVVTDTEPRWGRSAHVRQGEAVARPDVVEGGERLRAFLYVGAAVDPGEPGAD